MTGYRLTKLSLAIGLSIATSSALASPQSFMSARSFAMGGTGVAVATPSSAPDTMIPAHFPFHRQTCRLAGKYPAIVAGRAYQPERVPIL